MKGKDFRVHKCEDCGVEFLSKYARKHHVCGHVARNDISRVEAIKMQRDAAARRQRMLGQKT